MFKQILVAALGLLGMASSKVTGVDITPPPGVNKVPDWMGGYNGVYIPRGFRRFGRTITNSDGRVVPVRYIGEQHVKEDCGGRIPTVQDWFQNIKMESWMNRGYPIQVAEGAST